MQKEGRVKKLEFFSHRPSFFNIQCQGSRAPYYDTHGLFASILPRSYNLSIKAS